LIIESVTGISFGQNLHDRLFSPQGMDDSYLMMYTQARNQPAKSLGNTWLEGVEISRFASLSADWSGGGIISTTDDMLRFSRALHGGQILSQDSLITMANFRHKFRDGFHYGLGMMELHFQEFFFLLGRLPRLRSHSGILATHLYYDPVHTAHIVMNLSDDRRMVESVMALIEIEQLLMRM